MVDKHDVIKNGLDVVSGALAFSAAANVFDPILTFFASILSIIWLSLRIWDHKSIRKLTGRVE